MHRNLIRQYVPDAFVFHFDFPPVPFPQLRIVPKVFDFVFFAHRVIASKGIECSIEALSIIVKKYPTVSLLVVGSCDSKYKEFLQSKIEHLRLEKNIVFHDYFEKQEDMLQYVMQARFALLPIKLDVISGTIIQAMRMGLPVITHITTGTPNLNKEKKCVMLSPIDEIPALAANMIEVYENEDLASELRNNSIEYCKREDERKALSARVIIENCYYIIDNYNNHVPIPQERLYNT